MNNNDQMKIFAKNLNYYIAESGKTQKEVAADLGFNQTTFNTWCVGKILPSVGKIQKIADYFGIGKTNLLEDKPYQSPKEFSFVTIPVFASVSAGTGAFADGNIEGYTDIPISMARKGDFFGLRVDGDSMEPTIHDNDIIIVNREGIPRDGQIVVAVVNGDEGFCKRFIRHENGIGLMSDNPLYRQMIFSKDEVENKPVRILGTVTRIIRDIA